jgi:methylenetetrahydrofolate dehydrogenase (NADP+)/methenyltetrahydrofolate cyclohydrolase
MRAGLCDEEGFAVSAELLKGKPIADKIKERLQGELEVLRQKITPKLVALMVGDNKGAEMYAQMQAKACDGMGIPYELRALGADTTQDELEEMISGLNEDSAVTGIILQVPVPPHIDARAMQAAISPLKDVDGVHPANLGAVVHGDRRLGPCTAQSVVELVEASGVEVKGAEVCVVGHSEIVGKPVALLLLDQFATTTVCHIETKDTPYHTRTADILVSATGVAGLVKPDWIKPGALVIDVGAPKPDVAEGAEEVAGILTPVPGGVGPLTVTMLLKNTIESAKLQLGSCCC